jgi:PAS domain S-box-containing protein
LWNQQSNAIMPAETMRSKDASIAGANSRRIARGGIRAMVEPQSPKGQILLLEAEQEAPGPLAALLAARGYLVRAVSTVEQALHNLRDAAFDMLLLGNSLPAGTQAEEICRRIRAAGTPSDLPMLVVSDTAEPATISDLVAAGATEVLVLPFGERLFAARLEAHLELTSLRSKPALPVISRQGKVTSRRQDDFLTTVLESLTHPFYVINVHDYSVEMANSAARFERLTGDSTCYALTHRRDTPCDSDEHPCPIEELRRTGQPVTVEHLHYDAQGKERFVEVHSYPLFDEQGTLSRAIEYTLDITERKRVENALREASEEAEQARQAERERRLEADQRRRVAESLAGVVAALNSDQPLEHVLDHIAAQTAERLGNQAVAIYGLDPANRELDLKVSRGPLRADLQAIHQLCSPEAIAQSLDSRRPLVADATRTPSSHRDHQEPALFAALLAMPVIVKDQVYGGLVICSSEPRSFSAEEVELASVFANHVALAVESAEWRLQRDLAAAAAERNRLARDLHDSVSQALFSATLVADVLPQVWERDPALASEGLQELGELARGALAEMRTMLLELRPTAVLESRLHDLVHQLAEALAGRAGLQILYKVEPCPILPPEAQVTFYRIAQEALNNIVKHAEAKRVTVSLVAAPPVDESTEGDWQGRITLAISDDGQGFVREDLTSNQLGLDIMQERADTIGAELRIKGLPGQGTRVTLAWQSPGAATPE